MAQFLVVVALAVVAFAQTAQCGKFGPFGPFGPFAPGGPFGAFPPPSPLGDPLMDGQVQVAQLTGQLRMASMEYGRQIGINSAMTGKQISSVKIQTSAALMQNKNEIKATQNAAKLQGVNIDHCVTAYDNGVSTISANDIKIKCMQSPQMVGTKANLGKLKLLQAQAKNTVATCQLKFPAVSATQAEDINGCVTDSVTDITEQYKQIKEDTDSMLNDASQNTCVQDSQVELMKTVDDSLDEFTVCVADATAANTV